MSLAAAGLWRSFVSSPTGNHNLPVTLTWKLSETSWTHHISKHIFAYLCIFLHICACRIHVDAYFLHTYCMWTVWFLQMFKKNDIIAYFLAVVVHFCVTAYFFAYCCIYSESPSRLCPYNTNYSIFGLCWLHIFIYWCIKLHFVKFAHFLLISGMPMLNFAYFSPWIAYDCIFQSDRLWPSSWPGSGLSWQASPKVTGMCNLLPVKQAGCMPCSARAALFTLWSGPAGSLESPCSPLATLAHERSAPVPRQCTVKGEHDISILCQNSLFLLLCHYTVKGKHDIYILCQN